MSLSNPHESLKRLCPIEIIKGLGNEALWMFNTAKAVKEMVGEMTFQDWDDSLDLQEASITYFEPEDLVA